jgi:hypothetical protein
MNTKRLLILAAFLETVPEHKFNLRDWRESHELRGWRESHELSDDENYVSLSELNASLSNKSLMNHSCSTTGCAIGHACTIPEFIEDGFTWQDSSIGRHQGPLLTDSSSKPLCSGWSAVEYFFSIDQVTSQYLFDQTDYDHDKSGSKDVANRICEVVSKFNKE